MKKLLAIILIFVFLAGTAQAEPARKGGGQDAQDRGARMARMQEEFGLSDEQMAQMREIRMNGGSREEMRAVLTDEQRAMMEERRRAQQGQRGQKGDHRQGEGSPPSDPDGD